MSWTYEGPHGPITIEEAQDQDAAATLRIHREVLIEGEWFITRPAEFLCGLDLKLRQIREHRREDNSVFLVARRGGEVTGFLTLRGASLERLRHVVRLEIMVDRRFRGEGIGRALMTASIAWAEASPVVSKLSLSVFATNTRAIDLYRRFGFEEEGHRLREYRMEDGSWRDDLLMFRWV